MRKVRKVKSKHIKKCPVCGNKKTKQIYSETIPIKVCHEIILFKRAFSLCNQCDMVYVSDILPKSLMDKVYSSGIINSSVTYNEDIQTERYKFITNNIDIKKGISICDVGCNVGDFLSLFDKETWDAHGVELSNVASEICRTRLGINVYCCDWNNISFEQKFDIITCIHTLEHTYTPTKFIKKCHKSLKDEGFLYIEVPTFNNLKYLSTHPYNPTSTLCPSTNSLVYLLRKCGFYIYKIEEERTENYEAKVKILAIKRNSMEYMKSERKQTNRLKEEIIRYIKDMLIKWSVDGKQIYIYGAGNNSIDLLLGIKDKDWNTIKIEAFMDKDETKVGMDIFGIPIIKFGDDVFPDAILILSKKGIEMNMYHHIKKSYPNAIICTPYEYISKKYE